MTIDRAARNAVVEAAAARTASWLTVLDSHPITDSEVSASAAGAGSALAPDVLDGVRRDVDGFDFTRRLLQAVISESDPFAAALSLREVSRELPESMPALERLAVRVGGIASLGLPWAVLPVARKFLRERLSHLVLLADIPRSTERAKLGELRAALLSAGDQIGETLFALAGTEVLGRRGAAREFRRLVTLIEQPETRRVAVDVGRLIPESGAHLWALDHDAKHGAEVLRALLEKAQEHDVAVVLESGDYRGALLAPQVLAHALSHPGLERVQAGVSLPAELPESLQAAEGLILVSKTRVAAGAEPLEITIGTSTSLSREQIESIQSGLAVPSLETAAEQQGQLLRVLRLLLDAGDAVRTVVASDDAMLLAAATLLADRCGQSGALTLQLRAGTALDLETAIGEHGFTVRRRLPLTTPREFDGLVEYLIGLAAESADPYSELARTRALLAGEPGAVEAETRNLAEAIDAGDAPAPASRRVQHREQEWREAARDTASYYRPPTESTRFDTGGLTAAVLALTRSHTGEIGFEPASRSLRLPVISATGFANEPDTDASRYENRGWVRGLLARARRSDSGIEAVKRAEISGGDVSGLIDELLSQSEGWCALRASERGTRVARLALAAASARDILIEVLTAESGAPVPIIDHDVNGAIDAARYIGSLAGGLGTVRGARFHPERLALVVADAGVPLAERAEAVLAVLAAGSAAVLLTHPSVARSSAMLIEEWHAAGLPEGVVRLAVAAEGEEHAALAAMIAADGRVGRALVAGHRETAQTMLRRRPDLRVEGRFRALGVSVITPSADPETAVRNAVASAFGGGHDDARATRALVLLGTAARSKRVRRQLVDAVRSLTVGDTARPKRSDPLAFGVGPLAEPPDDAGLRALTELEAGEEWLVRPKQLDDAGRLWRPGVRIGVKRRSRFWGDCGGVPVIGVIAAHTVDEAISLTNELGGGGVAGLQANDPNEIVPWLERVHAASLFVGRPTIGGRIERQPGGGWGGAGMGASTLSGGPSRLLTLGAWELREGTASSTLHLRGLKPEVRLLIEAAQATLDYQSFDRVRRAALADALAWRTQLGGVHDVSGLGIERNLLRRRPVSTHIRLSEGAPFADLIRVLAAGLTAGAELSVSTGLVLPPEIGNYLAKQGVAVSLERDEAWLERIAVTGPSDESLAVSRVRLIGGNRVRTAEWLGGLGDIALWAEPVTMAGPIEVIAFLREQSISIAAHRYSLALLPEGVGTWIAELQAEV